MKKIRKTHWFRTTLLVLIACGLAGTVLAAFRFSADAPAAYASAKIQFSFEKASEGIAPDGKVFDLSGLTSEEIITAGLEGAGLQDGYTADQIRECLTVSGEYPETYLEQMTRYVSLLTGGADTEQTVSAGFRPTQYTVQLSSSFNRNISPEKLTELLTKILEVYRANFIREHAVPLPSEFLEKKLNDFDYSQQLEILSETSAQRQRYAEEMETVTEDFSWGGLSFGDIVVRYQALDSEIDRLNAQITLNVISRDRDRLQKRYEMEIRDQKVRLESLKDELEKIEELVKDYEKEGIIYVSSNGTLQKVESNTSTTYDQLVTKRKEVADSIASVNARIALYQGRLDDMTGGETETAGDAAKTEAAAPAPETEAPAAETAAGETSASEEEILSAAEEAAEIAVSEQTEEDVARLNEAMEQRIARLLEKKAAADAQFSELLEAYSAQKMNESTVTLTAAKLTAPKYLSGAFVKQVLKTAGPFCALGLMVCLALMILGRIREDRAARKTAPNL